MTDNIKTNIKQAIQAFAKGDFTKNGLHLFETLQYPVDDFSNEDNSYAFFSNEYILPEHNFDELKAMVDNWLYVDWLFQFTEGAIQDVKAGMLGNKEIISLAFLCIELEPANYTRTQLANITRQVNKVFSFPVIILFKNSRLLTISIIEQRNNKKDEYKTVLEKVTQIKDIDILSPHRAHIEILFDLSFQELLANHKITHFVELHNAWQKTLDTRELNKRFFKKVANWYFWAVAKVKFPYEYLKAEENHKDKTDADLQELANQKAVIRLITRIIFIWFIKEKKLVPENLFDEDFIYKTIKKDKATNYYNAILQNLFFATLNRIKEHRGFALDEGFPKNKTNFDVNSLYRYEKMFSDTNPENIMQIFESIPFLNGGLFDSLDKKDKKDGKIFIDGFTRILNRRALVHDFLFFENKNVDFNESLNRIYSTGKVKYEVKGLFEIFNDYKFTIEENTPEEQDVALDPILLGEIFENLLAYYNPETATTARKGTGSFYTPQPIVNYMVEESIKAYLNTKLNTEIDLNTLTEYNAESKYQLIKALSEIKILDPACGSGAFPMGILYKIVQILKTIDPDNHNWKKVQKEKLLVELDKAYDKDQKEEREAEIKRLNHVFENNLEDYGRKLYIIRNCIYGVDIQDVAIQISKLRFFLALIIDQPNEHIEPLPNLETKFVVANTLIGIDLPDDDVFGEHDPTREIKEELKKLRERHFTASDRNEKNKLKEKDEKLRQQLATTIETTLIARREQKIKELKTMLLPLKAELTKAQNLPKEIEIIETTDLFGALSKHSIDKTKARIKEINDRIFKTETQISKEENTTASNKIIDTAKKLAHWDIYDQNTQATWFDMNWMFGVKEGFDVVIGNPPYGVKFTNIEKELFRKIYPEIQFKIDSYSLFVLKSILLLKEKGQCSYIITNTLLDNYFEENVREKILNNTSVKEINDLDDKVFETAVVHTMIFSFLKGVPTNNFVKSNFSNNLIEGFNLIPQEYFLSQEKFSFSIREFENKDLIAVIKKDTITLDKVLDLRQAIKTGNDENYILTKATKKNHKPILRGKDVFKWAIYPPGLFVDYGKHLACPRNYSIFEQPKILIREAGATITASIDEYNYYVMSSLYNGIPIDKKFNLKFILSLINSRLFQFIMNKMTFEKTKGAFTKAKIYHYEKLPIRKANEMQQLPFIALVDQILAAKAANPKADTSALEKQIDDMVYKLYELTEEEKAIIENKK